MQISKIFSFERNSLLAFAIAASTVTAAAAEIADSSAISEIVVTATRTEQPINRVGQSVTVLAAEALARQQRNTVSDALRSVPGLSVTRNGGAGQTTSVFIRGADSEQTVVLIDGVKLNDPASPGGAFDFSNLLTSNIERIEVVRGSQSVLWGSQAIGGVVNIITRQANDEPLAISGDAEYGANKSSRLVGNAVANFLTPMVAIAADIGANYAHTDGVSAFNKQRGGNERDSYRNYGGHAKFKLRFSDAVSLDLRSRYADGKSDYDGFAPPDFNFGDTREYGRTREFAGYAGLNVNLLDDRLHNRLGYSQTSINRDNFDPDGFFKHSFDAKGTNERFEYQGVFEISEQWQTMFGAETEKARSRTEGFGGPVTRTDSRIDSVYAQLMVTPVPELTATVGVRHDDHDRFGGATTLAGNAVYTPNDGLTTLRASYGEGFKAPSLFQLFSDFGNNEITPETSDAWDVGISQRIVGVAMEVGVTWFQRNTQDQIDFVSCFEDSSTKCIDRPFGTYDNIRKSSARGAELTLAWQPLDALSVAANYSWLEAENDDTGNVLARRPEHTFNASLDYRWPFGLSTGLTVTRVGASFDNAANTRRLDRYTLVDLLASMPVSEQFEVFGRIENLLDDHYETVFEYGTPRRGAFAGVRVRW